MPKGMEIFERYIFERKKEKARRVSKTRRTGRRNGRVKQKRRLGCRGEEMEKKQSRKAERGEGGRGQAWSPSDPFA